MRCLTVIHRRILIFFFLCHKTPTKTTRSDQKEVRDEIFIFMLAINWVKPQVVGVIKGQPHGTSCIAILLPPSLNNILGWDYPVCNIHSIPSAKLVLLTLTSRTLLYVYSLHHLHPIFCPNLIIMKLQENMFDLNNFLFKKIRILMISFRSLVHLIYFTNRSQQNAFRRHFCHFKLKAVL